MEERSGKRYFSGAESWPVTVAGKRYFSGAESWPSSSQRKTKVENIDVIVEVETNLHRALNQNESWLSGNEEFQFRPEVQKLGIRSWDFMYTPEATPVLCDLTSSTGEIRFVFFHVRAMIGLFGCGLVSSVVTIFLDEEYVEIDEISRESWEGFWVAPYEGPFIPILFRRSGDGSDPSAGLMEGIVVPTSREEALSRFGIAVEGLKNPRFVKLNGSAAERAIHWIPRWKMWIEDVIQHIPLDEGLRRNLQEQLQTRFNFHLGTIDGSAAMFPLGVRKTERVGVGQALHGHASKDSREDKGSGSNVGEGQALHGQASKDSREDKGSGSNVGENVGEQSNEVTRPAPETNAVADAELGHEEKKLRIIVVFNSDDQPFHEYSPIGTPGAMINDENLHPGQRSGLQPKLFVDFYFNGPTDKLVTTKLEMVYNMRPKFDWSNNPYSNKLALASKAKEKKVFVQESDWFQNNLRLAFKTEEGRHVARETETVVSKLKMSETESTNNWAIMNNEEKTREIVLAGKGGPSALAQGSVGVNLKKAAETQWSEASERKHLMFRTVLADYPHFVVADHGGAKSMDVVAKFEGGVVEPSNICWISELQSVAFSSGIQSRVIMEAETTWRLFGTDSHAYEVVGRKTLSRQIQKTQDESGTSKWKWNKWYARRKKTDQSEAESESERILQVFTRKVIINHDFTEFFERYSEKGPVHKWFVDSGENPVVEAMTTSVGSPPTM